MADYRQRMADRIQAEMDAQSLDFETLAHRAGVNARTIRRLVRQETHPKPVTLRRIATGLGLDPREFKPPVELEEEHLERIETQLDTLVAGQAQIMIGLATLVLAAGDQELAQDLRREGQRRQQHGEEDLGSEPAVAE